MSHSRIYQIADKPVDTDNYICESDFFEHWFVGSIADYVSDDCNRTVDINSLKSLLKHRKAADFDEQNGSFVILPGGKEAYFAQNYDAFISHRDRILNVSLTEFASCGEFAEAVRLMGYAFNDEYGYYTRVNEDELRDVRRDRNGGQA